MTHHKLYVPLALYHKLQAYGKAAPGEVSGLGMITQLDNKRDFRVTEVMLFRQKAHGAETKLDLEDVAAWMASAVVNSVPLENVRLWWHFHVGSNTAWSGKGGDEDQIESWNGQCSWMVSFLLTKDGPMVARLDVYNPVRTTIPLEIVVEAPPMDEAVQATCAAEVKQKVEHLALVVHYRYPPITYLMPPDQEIEEEYDDVF